MNADTKRYLIWIPIAVVLVALAVGLVPVGISVFNESSKVRSFLSDDLKKHSPVEDVAAQLRDAGYHFKYTTTTLNGTGPVHSFLFYQTNLTVKVDFDDDQMVRYDLERK
jgi:flagellar basal body-associated protein FliL